MSDRRHEGHRAAAAGDVSVRRCGGLASGVPMSTTAALSPTEARGLRRRRAVAQAALAALFGGSVVAFLKVSAEQMPWSWLAVALPAGAACLVLHVRGLQYPRCRNSVFGPRDVDENTHHPSDPGFGPGLPACCKSCGVRLTPAAEAGGESVGAPHTGRRIGSSG